MRKSLLVCGLLFSASVLMPLAAAANAAPAAARSEQPSPAAGLSDAEVRGKADALLKRMTMQEKLGQMVQYFYFKNPDQATVAEKQKSAVDVDAAIARGEVGSLLLVTDPSEINRLQRIAVEKSRLKIPMLFGFDVIHGLRTIMPVPIGMAASWDPDMVERAQAIAAAEARAVGIDWTFAPMIDIARDARWGRIVESGGEDPVLGAAMAAAQVRGFQGAYIGAPGHVIATPKHFVGYGASVGGRDYDEVDLPESQLRNVYMPPFKAAVDAGAGSLMSAYMSLNGVPAAANRWLLTKVLRQEWGFKGFVVTDANGVNSLELQGVAKDDEQAAVRALSAGVDMAMSGPATPSPMLKLGDALKQGKINAAMVDDAVRRVLEAKIRMGLFAHPYVDAAASEKILNDPAHRDMARIAAERSAVLLANTNGLLPLDRAKLRSVAVIGPLADSAHDGLGPWVFPGNKPVGVSVLDGLRRKLGEGVKVSFSQGVPVPTRTNPSFFDFINPPVPQAKIEEPAELMRAVNLAQGADVTVMVLGEPQNMEGEAASRSHLTLPGAQQKLLDAVIATGKPVVLVLMNGRPLDLGDARPGAVLEAWYPGSEGGNAVANLLLGDAVPGGKLPFSWIRSAGQAPYTYAYLPSHAPTTQTKRYWDADGAPVWPFGYGLSYTTFAYSHLTAAPPVLSRGQGAAVSFDLTNTGKRAGDEVAQLYIHQRGTAVSRPVRELKKFERVHLDPGETRHITFTLTPDDLRYWSEITHDWVEDGSGFDVWVGGSSQADLETQFTAAQ